MTLGDEDAERGAVPRRERAVSSLVPERRERTVSSHVLERRAQARLLRQERGRSESVPSVVGPSEGLLPLPSRPHQHSAHYASNSSIPQFSHITNPNKLVRFRWEEKKLICGVVAAHLLFGCILGVFVPFFPTEAELRGISQTVIGGVFAIYALTIFLGSPIVSKLIPLVGASRMFNVGLGVAGAATLAFGVLDRIPSATGFIISCYVMRVIEAVGTAAFYTASYTVVANKFPENINMLVGTAETMMAVGVAAGPAMGGGLYSVGGYGLPFYVLGGTILVVAIASSCLIPFVGGDESRVRVWAMTKVAGRSTEVWLNLVAVVTLAIAWTAMDPGLAPYVDRALGISPASLGLYFLLASGIYAIVGPVWGKLCDDIANNYIQMTACLVLGAVGVALISPQPLLHLPPSHSLVALGLTMRELFIGGAFIPTFGNMLRASQEAGLPEDLATQAYVSGIMSSAWSIGNSAGPLAAGVLTDRFGYPITVSALSVCALVLAVVLGVQCVYRWRQLRGRTKSGYDDDETLPLLVEPAAAKTPG